MQRHLVFLGLCAPWFSLATMLSSSFTDGQSWYDEAKFGLFIHWAPISQWGDELSWPLECYEFPCLVQSVNHTNVNLTDISELKAHRQGYMDLAKTFNPLNFDPAAMAEIAVNAGFKYVVFTAVHCDGYANFNSSVGYGYSSMTSPFATDSMLAITRAFRAAGLRIGAYVCPSMWQRSDYWHPDPLTSMSHGCFPSYEPLERPDLWHSYINYMHSQVQELIDQYQPDLFWFDCVNYPPAMDYFMEDLHAQIREANNDAIMTNRDGGLFQDFVELTDKAEIQPEAIMGELQMVAGKKFEVCTTLDGTGQWGWNPDAQYRSPRDILRSLIRIVSKGGNFLVNIGPNFNGVWDAAAVEVLQNISDWMSINGEAIFGTSPMWPFEYQPYSQVIPTPVQTAEPLYITGVPRSRSPEGPVMYVLLPTENDTLPEALSFPWVRPAVFSVWQAKRLLSVELLGYNNSGGLHYTVSRAGLFITLESNVTSPSGEAQGSSPITPDRIRISRDKRFGDGWLQYVFVFKLTFE